MIGGKHYCGARNKLVNFNWKIPTSKSYSLLHSNFCSRSKSVICMYIGMYVLVCNFQWAFSLSQSSFPVLSLWLMNECIKFVERIQKSLSLKRELRIVRSDHFFQIPTFFRLCTKDLTLSYLKKTILFNKGASFSHS